MAGVGCECACQAIKAPSGSLKAWPSDLYVSAHVGCLSGGLEARSWVGTVLRKCVYHVDVLQSPPLARGTNPESPAEARRLIRRERPATTTRWATICQEQVRCPVNLNQVRHVFWSLYLTARYLALREVPSLTSGLVWWRDLVKFNDTVNTVPGSRWPRVTLLPKNAGKTAGRAIRRSQTSIRDFYRNSGKVEVSELLEAPRLSSPYSRVPFRIFTTKPWWDFVCPYCTRGPRNVWGLRCVRGHFDFLVVNVVLILTSCCEGGRKDGLDVDHQLSHVYFASKGLYGTVSSIRVWALRWSVVYIFTPHPRLANRPIFNTPHTSSRFPSSSSVRITQAAYHFRRRACVFKSLVLTNFLSNLIYSSNH